MSLSLCFFPSLTVQILEESSAGPRRLELQPRCQVHPVLLLQEHCALHYRGKKVTLGLDSCVQYYRFNPSSTKFTKLRKNFLIDWHVSVEERRAPAGGVRLCQYGAHRQSI